MIVTLPTFLIWILSILLPSLSNPAETSRKTIYATVYSNKTLNTKATSDNIYTGLTISSDDGQTWRSIGWKNAATNDFCLDPRDRKIIFLACDHGILKTTDEGKSWKLVSPWYLTMVKQIKIHSSKPDRVVVGTAKGFFFSEDGGNSWNESSDGLKITNGTFISCIVFTSNDADEILLGTEAGMYRTEDGGKHWRLNGLEGKAIRALVQNDIHKKVFAAATAREGVFLSEDGGKSWTERSNGLMTKNMVTIAFDPAHENILYCTSPGYGIYQSTDQGKTWSLRARGLTNFNVTAVCIDPNNPKRIIAGTKSGSFISTDQADHWSAFTIPRAHISTLRIEQSTEKK